MELGQIEGLMEPGLKSSGNSENPKKVGVLLRVIRETNELLQQSEDLTPDNLLVSSLMERLSLLLQLHWSAQEVQTVLQDAYMVKHRAMLQEKWARAEFELELADARRFYRCKEFHEERFQKLPYWPVYKSLVAAELAAHKPYLAFAGREKASPIVFVGSGPMPLSSILLHLCTGMEIICLDSDQTACESACSLLAQAGLSHGIKVVMEKGEAFDYSPYRIIFVASLVRDKRAVLSQINATSPDSLVAVRTAEGMRQIRYEAVDEAELINRGWRIVSRTRPESGLVINSTLILERSKQTGMSLR